MKKVSKLMAALLALVMCLSLLPLSAFADESGEAEAKIYPDTPVEIGIEENNEENNKVQPLPEDDKDQEAIDGYQEQGKAAAANHNAAIEALNNELAGELSTINTTLDGVDKSDDLKAAEAAYTQAQNDVDDAAKAMTDIEVTVADGETLTFATLDALLAYVNAASGEIGEPYQPDESTKPVEQEYSEVETIAAAQKAVYEAKLNAWKAQQDAAAAEAGEAAAEAAAAEAAKKAAAAAKAEELIEAYNSAVGTLNDSVDALKAAAKADTDAIDAKVLEAQEAYEALQAKAEQEPAAEGSDQTYEQQLDAAKTKLEALKEQQAKLEALTAQLKDPFKTAQDANDVRKAAETAKTKKEEQITDITDDYGEHFADKDLEQAQGDAQAASDAITAAEQFETAAKELEGQQPTYGAEVSADQLDALNAVEDAKTYLNGDFQNVSVDKEGTRNPTKDSKWLNQKLGKSGDKANGRDSVATRGEILTAYLTKTPDDYKAWWEKGFEKDPFVNYVQGKYDASEVGDGLKRLMALVDAADPAEYQAALTAAKEALGEAAASMTDEDIIKAMNDNPGANADKRDAWKTAVEAFIDKYELDTSFDAFDIDKVVAASEEDVSNAKDAYVTAIEALNASLGLIAEDVKLDTDAEKRDSIVSKFAALKEKQNELNGYLEALNGTVDENGERVEGLIEKATKATDDYHTKYDEYVAAVEAAQEAYDHVKSVNAAIDKALDELNKLQLNSADELDALAMDKINDLKGEIAALMEKLEDAKKEAAERTDDVEAAKDAADKAKEDADKAVDDAKKAAEEAAEKVKETEEALKEAEEALKEALDEEARRRAEEEAERLRQELEELRRALEALNETEIDEPAIPLAAGPVTRAQFVDYLWRHEGEPEAPASTFTDVPADHEYAPAIGWAQSIGLVSGNGNGEFEPDELVTVAAVRAILTRFASVNGMAMPELTALAGDDGEAVLNCDEILAEFFGEEYTPALDEEIEIAA